MYEQVSYQWQGKTKYSYVVGQDVYKEGVYTRIFFGVGFDNVLMTDAEKYAHDMAQWDARMSQYEEAAESCQEE